MPKCRVLVSYWCGFTKDREWQDHARAVFEAQGWTAIGFGNAHSEDYVPWSSNVDGDEIEFIAQGEGPDRAAVDRVLAGVGIERTTYVTIEECKAV